jgi:hypothetical protein
MFLCYTLPMNKLHIILGVIIFILSSIFGVVLYKNKHQTPVVEACPADVMMCPNGTSIGRSGPNCEFGICKQELPSYMEPLPAEEASSTPTSLSTTTNSSTRAPNQKKNIVKKVADAASALIDKVSETLGITQATQNAQVNQTSSPSSQNNQEPTSEKSAIFNETRYTIVNDSIVDENGIIIYTFPPSTSVAGWTTHVVNVVPTNSVAAVINSIPIVGQPGQFYISENSLGNIEACEFSNKVYILDIKTGEKILMYEESNTTTGSSISRSCTSELYLLATESEKLILKSHTVGTGTTCEGTWSEPEQTWYLDVTKLEKGLRRYIISPTLYYKAETDEKNCRTLYEATTTSEETIGG